jgi:3-oxoacyl-[acyl-carrier protein] reductase
VHEDAVVIVTGAGGGLGGAMVRALLAAGRRVVATDLPDAPGLAALRGENLHIHEADLRNDEAGETLVDAAYRNFGGLHALVNNAAIGPRWNEDGTLPRFHELAASDWRTTLGTNVVAPFVLARAVVPRLIAQGWGRVVNVTTGFLTMVTEGMSPYGPAKAALEATTAIWAKELATTGVTVNVLIPGGGADTAMMPLAASPNRDALTPPDAMAAPIVWLISDASAGTNGKRIIARDWDPKATLDRNLRAAIENAAWEG